MLVNKYIPEKLYGFCSDLEGKYQVFFHLGAFQPGAIADPTVPPPPPILGEEVEVDIDPEVLANSLDRAPKATSVRRLVSPLFVEGRVDTFDAHRGFGFVRGSNGVSYHLHKSEVTNNRIPMTGQRVQFYAGRRMGKPRACHVNVVGDK